MGERCAYVCVFAHRSADSEGEDEEIDFCLRRPQVLRPGLRVEDLLYAPTKDRLRAAIRPGRGVTADAPLVPGMGHEAPRGHVPTARQYFGAAGGASGHSRGKGTGQRRDLEQVNGPRGAEGRPGRVSGGSPRFLANPESASDSEPEEDTRGLRERLLARLQRDMEQLDFERNCVVSPWAC